METKKTDISSNELAPVVLFVYRRPEHTLQTLRALSKNKLADCSSLFIYSDGPKNVNDKEEIRSIEEVRKIIRKEKWCKEVIVYENNENAGLANSVIKGVTEIVNEYGKIIVLEDDLVTSPYFLEYMNSALTFYSNANEVLSISGYMFPVKEKVTAPFFLKFDSSWGWSTWKRAWDKFNPNADFLFEKITPLRREFDFNNAYYFYEMLLAQKKGEVDSWSIRWYASIFLENGYTLFPPQSYVLNIGHDGSGKHSVATVKFDPPSLSMEEFNLFPDVIRETESDRKMVENYFADLKSVSFSEKLKYKLSGVFKRKK